MNISELYSKIKELLPVKQGDTDFQETLQKALSDYTSDVQQLDSSVFSNKDEKEETISKVVFWWSAWGSIQTISTTNERPRWSFRADWCIDN